MAKVEGQQRSVANLNIQQTTLRLIIADVRQQRLLSLLAFCQCIPYTTAMLHLMIEGWKQNALKDHNSCYNEIISIF
jgi:hypothetical protein